MEFIPVFGLDGWYQDLDADGNICWYNDLTDEVGVVEVLRDSFSIY